MNNDRYSKPIYKRVKHFPELINAYQGKPTYIIPQNIIEELRLCFIKNGIEPIKITRNNISRFLFEIGHSELYDSVNYLYSYFTGKPLRTLIDMKEFYFMIMSNFRDIQQPNNITKTKQSNILKSTIFRALLKRP